MSDVTHEIWLCSPLGYRLALLGAAVSDRVVWGANTEGGFSVTLPESVSRDLLAYDNVIEIWRAPDDGPSIFLGMGFIRRVDTQTDNNGLTWYIASGPDQNYILSSRIVYYYAGSAQAEKSAVLADNLIKDVVDENMAASATDATRELQAYGLTIQADLSEGESITRGIAYDNVYKACLAIAAASRALGTDIYFWLEPVFQADGTIGYDLRTRATQPGNDRRFYVSGGVLFAPEFGNVKNPVMSEDAWDEKTFVIAGGRGDQNLRIIQPATDTATASRSPLARRQVFVNASNEITTTGVLAQANETLSKSRAVRSFTASIVETPAARYQTHWGNGDLITISYRGIQFDVLIRTVEIKHDSGGEEISAKVEMVA